jgi:hypothetical protein
MLGLGERAGHHRGDVAPLAVLEAVRIDLPKLERNGVEVGSPELALPVDFYGVVLLHAHQVAVHLRDERPPPRGRRFSGSAFLTGWQVTRTVGPPLSTSVRKTRA